MTVKKPNTPSNARLKKENRGQRVSVKNDKVKNFSLGLKDIDETIVYYFNNVIQPSVIQNGKKKPVPILYGSQERWASVQKDGFYRDKNGKIQAPLIMYKRDSIEKNRSLGNKMDANNPINYVIFKKGFSKKNVYDRFSALNNRVPVEEYYGVIVPDYVNLTYSCMIFTDYIEQMNKIVESINFASDSYWGDPERFQFRAMIDNFTTTTELNQGEDRKVRTEFTISMLGHIIPDSINAQLNGQNKFYSKSTINFKIETAETIETLQARAGTAEKESSTRFFDTALTGVGRKEGMTIEQIEFVALNTTILASTVTTDLATFNNKAFTIPPEGFTITQESFTVYINGIAIPTNARTVAEDGSNITITFNSSELGYSVDDEDQVLMTGKFV